MTLREKVVEVLLNWLATFVRDTRDENVSAEQVADAILALLSTADSEQREVLVVGGNPNRDRIARALALPADSLAQEVVWTEGFDGEWTCSGCGRDWYIEAETPEANEYLHCPGCGRRIGSYKRCEDDAGDDEVTP